jgi:tRNA-dihydrouridine synthase
VKDHVNIPVIGNGSIFEAEDAIRMFEETGCDAVLLSRGALGNPFVFKQINFLINGEKYNPTIEEISKTALDHVGLLEKEQGLEINLDRAKKNIIWYFKYQNGVENLISELYLASDFERLKEIIIDHKNKLVKDFYPQSDPEEIKKKFKDRVLFWLAKEEEKV